MEPAAGGWCVQLLVRGGATRASSLLATRGREVAVLDTGMGHAGGSLVRELALRGVRPEEVTLVFNTHAHVDHSHNNVLFPRATIFCSARDREWTRRVHDAIGAVDEPGAEHVTRFYPELTGGGYDAKVVRKILSVEKLLWDPARLGSEGATAWLEQTAPPAGIRVIETPGHSPHHVSFLLDTGRDPVVVCGDALLMRGEEDYGAPRMPQWSTPAYTASLARLRRLRAVVVPGHDEPYHQT